jgi:PAS domain S-box-containing protein
MNPIQETNQSKPAGNPSLPLWSQALDLVLLACAYWLVTRLGLMVVAQPEGIASIWPASGLALAVLLLNPKRRWSILLTVIFITNALGNLSAGNPLLVSLGFALANSLEALLAAWLLCLFFKSRITFSRIGEVFALFGIAILSNGSTALLGALVPSLAFSAPFAKTWLVWWTSDGLGIILVAPLIVTWSTMRSMFQTASPRRILEAVVLILVLVVFCWLLFGRFTRAEEPLLRNYMLFPFLIWLAFRFSQRGMASALTILAIIAIWNTMQGFGIFGFADQSVTEHLVSVQLLLCVLSFTGLLLCAIVTERKQSEINLRESEDKFKYVFEYSNVGKSLTKVTGEIRVNKTFAEMLGFSSAELQMKRWQDITHPDDIELTQKEINNLLLGEKTTAHFEKRYLKKDGSTIWMDISTSLRRDETGKPMYFMTTLVDISDRKKAEEQIHILNSELEQRVEERTRDLHDTQEKLVRQEKLAVLGQLAGGVGHELRNPLSVINNAVYYLKLVQPQADEKIKQYLGLIDKETHNAEKIINDLLDFARVKSVDRQPFVVSDLVQRVLVRFPVPDSISTTLDFPADLPLAFADPLQMEQVLGNLVLNACQAMASPHADSTTGVLEAGHLTISGSVSSVSVFQQDVGVQSLLPELLLQVAVSDTGVGIAPENMKKVFEPLFTTKAKGIGLGLAVSRKLAESNDGRIEVHSQPGKGSTFTLFIPVAK